MTESSWEIRGGDFERAGAASRLLKEQLKKIGAAPEILRRAMMAAYEAQMNVVIHAHRGIMRAVLDDKQARVEIIDEGPGIARLERAMTEGYSTADRRARQLGFGAGMGLANIRRSADRFTLASDAGKGTRLCFTILLKPQARRRREAQLAPHCGGAVHPVPAVPLRLPHGGASRPIFTAAETRSPLRGLHELLHTKYVPRTRV